MVVMQPFESWIVVSGVGEHESFDVAAGGKRLELAYFILLRVGFV